MNALSRAIYRRIYRQCQEIDKCVSKRAMLEGHQVGYPVGDDKTNATRRIIERFWNLNGQSELWVPNTEKSIREVTPSLRESWREGGHLEDAMATMKILRDLVIEPQALPRLPYEPDIKSKQVFQVPHFDLKKPGEPAHILLAHPLLPGEFRHTVILLFNSNYHATLGTILNKPSVDKSETVTYEGGPVGIDQTLWVHRNTDASIIPGTEYAGGGMYQGGSHGVCFFFFLSGITLVKNAGLFVCVTKPP